MLHVLPAKLSFMQANQKLVIRRDMKSLTNRIGSCSRVQRAGAAAIKTTIKRWAQFTPQGQLIVCTISDSRMGSRQLLRQNLYPNEDISWMDIKKDGAVERQIEITFDEIPYETQIVPGDEEDE